MPTNDFEDKVVKYILRELAARIETKMVDNLRTSLKTSTTLVNSIDIDESDINNYNISILVGGDTLSGQFNVASGLEYGTGMYGPKKKIIEAKHLTKRGSKGFMKFKSNNIIRTSGQKLHGNIAFEKDGYVFTQKSRGIKPILFMTRALESVEREQEEIINDVLKYYDTSKDEIKVDFNYDVL